jgi:hypothetical protein
MDRQHAGGKIAEHSAELQALKQRHQQHGDGGKLPPVQVGA